MVSSCLVTTNTAASNTASMEAGDALPGAAIIALPKNELLSGWNFAALNRATEEPSAVADDLLQSASRIVERHRQSHWLIKSVRRLVSTEVRSALSLVNEHERWLARHGSIHYFKVLKRLFFEGKSRLLYSRLSSWSKQFREARESRTLYLEQGLVGRVAGWFCHLGVPMHSPSRGQRFYGWITSQPSTISKMILRNFGVKTIAGWLLWHSDRWYYNFVLDKASSSLISHYDKAQGLTVDGQMTFCMASEVQRLTGLGECPSKSTLDSALRRVSLWAHPDKLPLGLKERPYMPALQKVHEAFLETIQLYEDRTLHTKFFDWIGIFEGKNKEDAIKFKDDVSDFYAKHAELLKQCWMNGNNFNRETRALSNSIFGDLYDLKIEFHRLEAIYRSECATQIKASRAETASERKEKEAANARADAERKEKEAYRAKNKKLAAKLAALGISADSIMTPAI